MLTSGKLTERIKILTPKISRGTLGEQKIQYEPVKTTWANVVFQRGVRALTAGDVWLTRSITVTIRNNPIITDRCRIKWDNKTYQIDSFNRSATDGSITIVASVIDEGTENE